MALKITLGFLSLTASHIEGYTVRHNMMLCTTNSFVCASYVYSEKAS